MRKVFIALASCAALVAAMAFSAPAFAGIGDGIDPDCDGTPYPNDFALHGLSIVTTGSSVEHAVSGVTGAGVACGTDIRQDGVAPHFDGKETLNDHAVVGVAKGVSVNPTGPMDEGDPTAGRFTGYGKINAMGWTTSLGRVPLVAENQVFNLRVDSIGDGTTEGNCTWENNHQPLGPTPGQIVACYRGDTLGDIAEGQIPGHSWNWVTVDDQGRYAITIGRFYEDIELFDVPVGVSQIKEFALCAYAGEIAAHKSAPLGAQGCGDGSDRSLWLQKNGDWSYSSPPKPYMSGTSRCQAGYGQYTAKVVNAGDPVAGIPPQTTDSVSTCVRWTQPEEVALPLPRR